MSTHSFRDVYLGRKDREPAVYLPWLSEYQRQFTWKSRHDGPPAADMSSQQQQQPAVSIPLRQDRMTSSSPPQSLLGGGNAQPPSDYARSESNMSRMSPEPSSMNAGHQQRAMIASRSTQTLDQESDSPTHPLPLSPLPSTQQQLKQQQQQQQQQQQPTGPAKVTRWSQADWPEPAADNFQSEGTQTPLLTTRKATMTDDKRKKSQATQSDEPRQPPKIVPFGFGNTNPTQDELYMKTFNVTAPVSEIYPNTLLRQNLDAAVRDNPGFRPSRKRAPTFPLISTMSPIGAYFDAGPATKVISTEPTYSRFQTEYRREFLDWMAEIRKVRQKDQQPVI